MECVLFPFEKLLDLLFVSLHPLDQLTFSLRLFLQLLLPEELLVNRLLIPEVLLIDRSPDLSCRLRRSNRDLTLVDVFDSREILGSSKVTIASKARDLSPLCIVHFGAFDGPIVVTSQLFDPYLPMVKFPEQSIDFIIKCTNFIFGASSVLNLFDFLNDVRRDLFSPLFTFVKIIDLPYMS